MSKKICFIYTDTNGLHNTNDIVSTKNLYNYARMIALHYSIGTYEGGNFNEIKNVSSILKPKTINFDPKAQEFHNITFNMANEKGIDNKEVIMQLKADLKDVDVIVSHNLPFHLKAIQVECFRSATIIDFSKFSLIDTISFGHEYSYPKLVDLLKKLKIKNTKMSHLEQVNKVFFKLYETSIKI